MDTISITISYFSIVTNLSSTGIRQVSHRFISQIGLLLLFVDDIFLQVLYLAFSALTLPNRSYYTVLQSKAQCSKKIVFHLIIIIVMLSCHVMSCYVTLSDTTLPLFDTSVTVANMNNPRSDYNKCEYAQNVSIKCSNYKDHCLSSTRLLITCYTLNLRPRSDCGVSGRPEGWRPLHSVLLWVCLRSCHKIAPTGIGAVWASLDNTSQLAS